MVGTGSFKARRKVTKRRRKRREQIRLVALTLLLAASSLIKCSTMAEQTMRYCFVRAFIVEGLFAREAQEILLLDEPEKGANSR